MLDAAVGTIPIGTPNPPVCHPLRNIPNHGVGLSVHPDLARRSAKIDRAAFLVTAADAQRRSSVRGQSDPAFANLGDLAVASLRLSADLRLTAQSKRRFSLHASGVKTGFGPPLDADRAEIELLRLEQQIAADQGDILTAQAACDSLSAAAAPHFPMSKRPASFSPAGLFVPDPVPAD